MSDLAINVRGLGKRYHIAEHLEQYSTFRDAVARAFRHPWRRLRRRRHDEATTLWALRDLDLDIEHGEVIGVIGRNGAGKSTLLKILSRITEPTEGYARIRGRVGSLLEVGTGFHLELSGRENIYLNGAILGMRRTEIDRKFDEMVDFSGVEKFIDTPVKHYSSGMYLRLAFAVAAHLEPEILLVDEVLAVGDAAFQKKCIGKMSDVAAQGRTVLFVSHNLGAVKELCSTALVLANGELDFRGPVVDGIAHYSRSVFDNPHDDLTRGGGWSGVRVNGGVHGFIPELRVDEPFCIEGNLTVKGSCPQGQIFAIVENAVGDTIVHLRIDVSEACGGFRDPGTYAVAAEIPALWLAPGVYTVHLKFRADNVSGEHERYVSDRVVFDVRGSQQGLSNAVLAPECEWRVKPLKSTQSAGCSV